jgi:hypothetical protein
MAVVVGMLTAVTVDVGGHMVVAVGGFGRCSTSDRC